MKDITKILLPLFSIVFCSAVFADDVTSTSSTSTTVTAAPSSAAPVNKSATPTTEITVTHTTTTVSNNDDKIVTAIYAKYAKDPALIGTNLTVSSVNGVVTIFGKVVAQSQADEAVLAAKSVEGVKDARSSITVTTNPATSKAPTTAPNY